MTSSGHLRELKETPGFSTFLTQLAIQIQANIILLQLDGTMVFSAYKSKDDSFCQCTDTSYQYFILEIIHHNNLSEPYTTTCNCRMPLLLLPLRATDALDGILAVCPFEENQQQLLIGTAEMVNNYLSVARTAIQKSRKAFATFDAQEELFRLTEHLTNLDEFYNVVLEILLIYIDTEASIFIPRISDYSKWGEPVFQSKHPVEQEWLTQMAAWAMSQHDKDHCPMTITDENLDRYPEFQRLNPSAFISSTIYYDNKIFGIIIFCSRTLIHETAFDDLALLESLKGMLSLRLFNLHNQMFKERFLQDAFHSLKAPAHSITSLVDIIVSDINTIPQFLYEELKLLTQEAKRLFRLTQKAPMLARLHNSPGDQDKISLKDIVVEVVLIFKTMALNTKNVTIRLKTPNENCDIMGNKDELQEVLENLLENGLKFTEKDKTIFVNLEIRSSVYQVSVINEGAGIPQYQREIIFQEFKSIPRSGNPESSGLGLAISRKIIEAHRGVLKYVDPPNNSGACFTFTLPKL